MKNLKSVEDFVLNPDFRDWISNPTPSSNIFWEKWLKEHPEKRKNFEAAIRVLQLMGRVNYIPDPKYSRKIWEDIESGIKGTEKPEREAIPLNIQSVVKKGKNKPKSGRLGFWVSFAASVLILITCSYYFVPDYFINKSETDSITTIMKSNPKGQKSTIMLPDGTKVMLNSESTLTYTNKYNEKERRIRLKGEAFFEVAKNPEKPFIVETNHLRTIALGTSFNIDAFNADTEEVTLVQGKVKIESSDEGSLQDFLNPGEMVVFDREKGIEKTIVYSFDHLGWKDGVIVFQDTPLKQAVAELEQWYGVEIELRGFPQDYDMNCTGSFDNDNLENVLSSLSYTMSFEFEIIEKKAVLKFK